MGVPCANEDAERSEDAVYTKQVVNCVGVVVCATCVVQRVLCACGARACVRACMRACTNRQNVHAGKTSQRMIDLRQKKRGEEKNTK